MDLIHIPYRELKTERKRIRNTRYIGIIYLHISKVNLTLPSMAKQTNKKTKKNSCPCPVPQPHTYTYRHTETCTHMHAIHTHAHTCTRRHFLWVWNPEWLAWNSKELGFHTGRLESQPCCPGAGGLEKPLNFSGSHLLHRPRNIIILPTNHTGLVQGLEEEGL